MQRGQFCEPNSPSNTRVAALHLNAPAILHGKLRWSAASDACGLAAAPPYLAAALQVAAALAARGLATATGTVSVAIPLDHADLFSARCSPLSPQRWPAPVIAGVVCLFCTVLVGKRATAAGTRRPSSCLLFPSAAAFASRSHKLRRKQTQGCFHRTWKSTRRISALCAARRSLTTVSLRAYNSARSAMCSLTRSSLCCHPSRDSLAWLSRPQLRQLGVGAFGEVHLAIWKGARVACKRLKARSNASAPG